MKYMVPTLIMLTLSMNASGQKVSDADVPPAVKAAFVKQFPKAGQARWEMEDGKDYEAEFKQDGTKWSAKYNAAAKWLETEHAIEAAALPEAVRKSIASGYDGHKMEESELVETPDGTVYEVALEKGKESLEVVFSADGKVLKSKVEDEDDEEGDDDEKD